MGRASLPRWRGTYWRRRGGERPYLGPGLVADPARCPRTARSIARHGRLGNRWSRLRQRARPPHRSEPCSKPLVRRVLSGNGASGRRPSRPRLAFDCRGPQPPTGRGLLWARHTRERRCQEALLRRRLKRVPGNPEIAAVRSQVDEKRPTCGCGAPKARVRHTSTRSRLFAQVDFRREMRPTAFVDPGAFLGTSRGVHWRMLRPRLHAFDCEGAVFNESPLDSRHHSERTLSWRSAVWAHPITPLLGLPVLKQGSTPSAVRVNSELFRE